jgi:hypothetical protein
VGQRVPKSHPSALAGEPLQSSELATMQTQTVFRIQKPADSAVLLRLTFLLRHPQAQIVLVIRVPSLNAAPSRASERAPMSMETRLPMMPSYAMLESQQILFISVLVASAVRQRLLDARMKFVAPCLHRPSELVQIPQETRQRSLMTAAHTRIILT